MSPARLIRRASWTLRATLCAGSEFCPSSASITRSTNSSRLWRLARRRLITSSPSSSSFVSFAATSAAVSDYLPLRAFKTMNTKNPIASPFTANRDSEPVSTSGATSTATAADRLCLQRNPGSLDYESQMPSMRTSLCVQCPGHGIRSPGRRSMGRWMGKDTPRPQCRMPGTGSRGVVGRCEGKWLAYDAVTGRRGWGREAVARLRTCLGRHGGTEPGRTEPTDQLRELRRGHAGPATSLGEPRPRAKVFSRSAQRTSTAANGPVLGGSIGIT